jgi:hypothetical protein
MITNNGKIARLDIRKQVYRNEINVINSQSLDMVNASYEALYYITRFPSELDSYDVVLELANSVFYSMREVNIIIGKPIVLEALKPYILEIVDSDIQSDYGAYKPTYLRNRYSYMVETLSTMKHSNYFHSFTGGDKFVDDILRTLDFVNHYLPLGNKWHITKKEEDYESIANQIYYLI